MATKKNFYITTPIYYVNAPGHIGHLYTTIAADILARWHRLKGEEVFLLTGTDEHGQKIQEIAEQQHLKPHLFVDKISTTFKQLFKDYNISNDFFIRTTDKEHEKEVQKVMLQLYDAGFIYKGHYEAYYCVGCEQYLTETDLVDGKCSLHNREPELRKEEAYLFKLSQFQNKLLKIIASGEYCILPEKKRKEIITFIESGLKDISVSRPKKQVYWGIELPFDKNHSTFIWCDAFWNYLTGLQIKGQFKKFWPPDVQFMASDILRVHSTIYPALLLATKNKLPKTLFVHGYFTVDGRKMSKSLGNVVNPVAIAKKYPVDAVRYYLFRDIPFGEDGDFSESGLKARYNNELANDLGNLVSRILSLAEKGFDGRIKKHPVDKKLSEKLDLKKISEHMDNLELHLALFEIMGFVKHCNKHVNDEKLWEKKGKELELHLYSLLEAIRIAGILLLPFIPESVGKINKQLGITEGKLKDCRFGLVRGYQVRKEGILFQKVDDEKPLHPQINSFSIEPPLKKQGINVCMALVKNISISNRSNKIEELKKEVAQKILAGEAKNKGILDGYREFYRKAGLDCIPAAENLVNLIQKNKSLPNINNVVDCYNVVSVESGLSFGAHDADKVDGKLRFKTTTGAEKFIPLGERLSVKINKGEYAFMDDKEVLCRMDIKQCEKTKITKNTHNVIIYAQGNRNVEESYLKDAVIKVCGTLKNIYGCEYALLKEVK